MSSNHHSWNTLFTKLFPCRLPIMGAPMAGVSGGSLAFETCKAGGLGFIAAGHLVSDKSLESLEREIQVFRDLSAAQSLQKLPLSIGFIGHSTFGKDSPGWKYVTRILEKHRPTNVQLFAPSISKDVPSELVVASSIKNNVELCQSYGCQVFAQVGSIQEGIEAMNAGVNCLIAQGTEAGG